LVILSLSKDQFRRDNRKGNQTDPSTSLRMTESDRLPNTKKGRFPACGKRPFLGLG
jgi:hypothetical protein